MKIKRIISLLLIACALIASAALVSCSDSDAPDGYQLIVNNGDKFRLFVPTQGWSANTYGGTTGAIYSGGAHPVTISVYVADDAGDMTMSEYWAYTEGLLKVKYGDDYEFIGAEENRMLGGKEAKRYSYKAKEIFSGEEAAVEYRYDIILCRNKEMYVMAFAAPTEGDYYNQFSKDLDGEDGDIGIIGHFTFAEPYEGKVVGETPAVEVPEGMQIASFDEHYYYFFVPESWKVNNRTTVSSAYFSEGDRSNVTMQMCMVSESEIQKTVDEYFRECEEKYKKIFTNYTPISVKYDNDESVESESESASTSDEELQMGGRAAKRFVYEFEYGGMKYRQMQVICSKGGVFYVLTYTSSQDDTFDSHLPDVEKMIETFKIR